ncbi:MAG: SCO family protein, partial [Pseudomonadota bacterium]|nr:SCO family protein [Pseudomonadota bacterium]
DIRSWSNFSDKPLYITTGFTACRLTCPITMKFYQKMASHTGDKVKYALFTIDPTSDTTAKLATYLNGLNPDFIGLRISNTVLFKKIISELQQGIYDTGERDNIQHKSYIYLIHPKLSGLVIYTKPDINLMINDLEIIERQND